MDWKETKSISLEIWDFFRKNPKFCNKKHLPKKLYNKISSMNYCCPLCEYFQNRCHDCPLVFCHDPLYGDYALWLNSLKDGREKYANIIYNKIKKWKNPEKRLSAVIKKWVNK